MSETLILLAEDNADHALLTTEALTSEVAGGETAVHVVHDGRALLDYLYDALDPDGPRLPQLIVLDLQLPDIDGFEAIRRLKADERLRSIPILVLTTSGDPRDVERSYELGSTSYAQKPLAPAALRNALAAIPTTRST